MLSNWISLLLFNLCTFSQEYIKYKQILEQITTKHFSIQTEKPFKFQFSEEKIWIFRKLCIKEQYYIPLEIFTWKCLFSCGHNVSSCLNNLYSLTSWGHSHSGGHCSCGGRWRGYFWGRRGCSCQGCNAGHVALLTCNNNNYLIRYVIVMGFNLFKVLLLTHNIVFIQPGQYWTWNDNFWPLKMMVNGGLELFFRYLHGENFDYCYKFSKKITFFSHGRI